MKSFEQLHSSYRDPSGFMFKMDGIYYRQVNTLFKEDFDYFIASGCYDTLVREKLLISHETIKQNLTGSAYWYLTLKPEQLSFISYPFEWSFDMLKDAALLTLRTLKTALAKEMILKDATPYNIQFHQGKMIFIDTLSFEKYNEEEPWVAYRQFCECFLGPLLLMHYKKMPLEQLFYAWPEGIPLKVIKAFLPGRSRFSLHTWLHIHLNARISKKPKNDSGKKVKFSKQKLLNIINSLENLTNSLKLSIQKSTWSEYYKEAADRDNYLEEKRKIIREWAGSLNGINTATDLGANDGVFSQLLAEKNIATIAADFDAYCINNLYNHIKKTGEKKIQPLIVDLANPGPAAGVNNEERPSLLTRLTADLGMALALIHHLAIGRNVTWQMMASLFSRICKKYLIIEFVSKTDPKVQLMLSGKKDIYMHYTEENFIAAFQQYFQTNKKQVIGHSGRTLYLFTRNEI